MTNYCSVVGGKLHSEKIWGAEGGGKLQACILNIVTYSSWLFLGAKLPPPPPLNETLHM